MTEVTISLTLTKLDALAIIGALEDGALSYRLQAAISSGQEREYNELRARTLREKAELIIDTLYAEQVAA